MDNPEELLHSLAEFVKLKPKEIPADLEQYLGYVAKTGDPVYQWSLVKALFREKLLNVITEFYETCPTAEPAPACPNVDMFNYETMKVGLVERLESFANAPFTVQRLCELLTAPRKQYSRADKFMRAVEKNMLVVSTREPGQPRAGQDVDMANGEDKNWLDRQAANASVDRSAGLELAAFRYEPFGSAPGAGFFPPMKQKLDDFLETDAAVSAIAPQAANLANLAAISPEQVAGLAAEISPGVANLAAEMPPEVAGRAAEISPVVANLVAEISPDVAGLAAEISPDVVSLAAGISPQDTSLAAKEYPEVASLPVVTSPEVATLAAEISPEDANLQAKLSPAVANLAAEITPEVGSLPAEKTPTVGNLATEISPEVANLVVEISPEVANLTAKLSPEVLDLPTEIPPDVANLGAEIPPDVGGLAVGAANPTETIPPASVGVLATTEEKMDVDPLTDSTNQGPEQPANQEGAEKMDVTEDHVPAAATNQGAEQAPTNQGDADTALANGDQAESAAANETSTNPQEAEQLAANEQGAEQLAANEQGAEPMPQDFAEKQAASENRAENEPTNESQVENKPTNESEAEKSVANESEADRRQAQSERVQSVIRENMEREEAVPPPAKAPRIEAMDDS